MGDLTPKQQRFVEEYIIDLNGAAAAVRAGYSERRARQTANDLLALPAVQEAVQAALAARSERTEITQDRVLQEFAKIGFADIRRIFTPGGGLLSPADMDDDTSATIASVEVVTRATGEKDEDGRTIIEHVHKIKSWDKVSALTQLGRHLGMFTDKVEHSGAIGGLSPEARKARIAELEARRRGA